VVLICIFLFLKNLITNKGIFPGKVDPRSPFDKEKMLKQAYELAALNPNVMIKIPGSKEGYEVITILTSKGISTNNTLAFTLPQIMDGAKSVKEGLEIAKKNNVDLSKWRSVLTDMEARYGDLGGLRGVRTKKEELKFLRPMLDGLN